MEFNSLADAYRTLGSLKADLVMQRAYAIAESTDQGNDVWQTRHYIEHATSATEAEIVLLEHEILAQKAERE